MSTFRVKALTEHGKIVIKEVEGVSLEDVSRSIKGEGLYPVEIKRRAVLSFFGAPTLKLKGSAKRRDFLVFNKGLVTLLKSGLPLVDCLSTLKERGMSSHFNQVLSNT